LGSENEELRVHIQGLVNNSRPEKRDSGVGVTQYEQLSAENEKLKFQLGDMIDKYKILYLKIKEMQEEREREKLEQKKSVNPFSIARETTSKVEEKEEEKEEDKVGDKEDS